MIYEVEEPRWNDIDRKIPNNSKKNLSHYHFVQLFGMAEAAGLIMASRSSSMAWSFC
jgi:hypothetical protein